MRRRKPLTPKEQLDRQTSYLTLLPHMDDGFHTGYHTNPGVVSDHNKRPAEWLESMARYMHTNGQDVGYSIPDVLACEQQLRRLSRLDADEVQDNQQLTDYRAVLAMLLLWDVWPQDDTWPLLELTCLSGGRTSFAASVTAALTPKRAPDGLWVFTLRSSRDAEAAVSPIALLSNAMVLIPAANPGDLSSLLPPCVRWYDRVQKCFTDPCLSISQQDAFMLVSRLRVLQALKEQPEWHSPLIHADEQLVSLLGRFANDLLTIHAPWQQRLLKGDSSALSSLRLRVLAACTQDGMLPIEKKVLRPAEVPLAQNPLLHAVAPESLPACTPDEMTLYMLDGAPFACQSYETLFKPADQPGEEALLTRLQNEISLLETHDVRWRQAASRSLRTLRAETQDNAGLQPAIPHLLESWAAELDAIPAAASREMTLDYPLTDCPAALQSLLGEALGMADEQLIRNIFSDALLIWQGDSAYDDEALSDRCCIDGLGVAVPPLSPALCRWLMESYDQHSVYAPMLDAGSFRFERQNDRVSVSFRILRRTLELGAAPVSAITFRRSYRLHSTVRWEVGSAVVLPAAQRPGVTVWPNARFAPNLWKPYYVFTEYPGAVSTWVCSSKGWLQGAWHNTPATSWLTACVDAFPAFVAFKRGEVSLGALINDLPRRLLKHEPAAAIAVDFGSISTTVMLRQEDRVQPASLPECMHRTLLKPGRESDLMTNAFLPKDVLLPGSPATYYSLMDMFTDDPERWIVVLRDGHIYYRSTLEALAQKNASALYYDLKWGEETYAQRVMRLFLKQVMMQAALSARLWGSSSASWRVSMPNAMPLHKQETYLELMRGLAREIAQETGLPLTQGCPAVLYASENQADGLYFLSRSEINAKNGYFNLDIGGSTADLSLWLGGAQHASMEVSLLMGCRQMLFASLMERHAADFSHDFDGMNPQLEEAIHQISTVYRLEGSTTRGQRKCMLLLDDLLATHADTLRACMAQSRAEGRISYLESLLLWQIGFLFYLAGDMLERAWQDSALRMMLPERMELCIAGNGGQLLKAFGEEQQNRLCSLALARLDPSHPLQMLLPIQSRHPKQEVARGLLYNDSSLHSAIQGVERHNGTSPDHPASNLLRDYLPLFYHVFPQAAQRLMPKVFEDHGSIALSATAHMELNTIFANESAREKGDDLAAYVRCFAALKRLWNI